MMRSNPDHKMTKTSINISRVLVFFIASILITLQSCQDPISVGGDLLDDERINTGIIDTLRVTTKTIIGEKVPTYIRNVDSRTYLLGSVEDAVFGTFQANLFFKHYLNSPKPSYTGAILDSVVLALRYDTLGDFGPRKSTQKIEVFQLSDPLSKLDTVYSDINIALDPNSLGSVTTVVNSKDSMTIFDHVTQKTLKLAPHVRIRLDQAWGDALIKDVGAATEDTIFSKFTKGFGLKSTPIDQKGIFGFNFSNGNLTSTDQTNKLIVYYHKIVADTVQRLMYMYPIQGNTINSFEINRFGTVAQDLIDNPDKGNDLSLIQGVSGVKTAITFDNLDVLKDKNISKVELDIYVGGLSGQSPDIQKPGQLIASSYDKNGKLVFIKDIKQLSDAFISFVGVFGGVLDTKSSVAKYTINITNHVKNVLSDPLARPEIVLGVLTEAANASQVVIYGGKHPQFPIKMRVYYAKN